MKFIIVMYFSMFNEEVIVCKALSQYGNIYENNLYLRLW